MNIIPKRDKKLGLVMKEFIGRNEALGKGLARLDIEAIYRAEMGPVVSSYTEKIYLRGNKLYIHIQSAPLRAELITAQDRLIQLLNKALGENIVGSIIFR
ncbi:MAG: DciA family protein [Saprospiraceae bacterium]